MQHRSNTDDGVQILMVIICKYTSMLYDQDGNSLNKEGSYNLYNSGSRYIPMLVLAGFFIAWLTSFLFISVTIWNCEVTHLPSHRRGASCLAISSIAARQSHEFFHRCETEMCMVNQGDMVTARYAWWVADCGIK